MQVFNCVCFSFHLENVFPLLTGQDLSSQGDVMHAYIM